jgi:hypothetical protein
VCGAGEAGLKRGGGGGGGPSGMPGGMSPEDLFRQMFAGGMAGMGGFPGARVHVGGMPGMGGANGVDLNELLGAMFGQAMGGGPGGPGGGGGGGGPPRTVRAVQCSLEELFCGARKARLARSTCGSARAAAADAAAPPPAHLREPLALGFCGSAAPLPLRPWLWAAPRATRPHPLWRPGADAGGVRARRALTGRAGQRAALHAGHRARVEGGDQDQLRRRQRHVRGARKGARALHSRGQRPQRRRAVQARISSTAPAYYTTTASPSPQ